jgi:hypothetical protein
VSILHSTRYLINIYGNRFIDFGIDKSIIWTDFQSKPVLNMG